MISGSSKQVRPLRVAINAQLDTNIVAAGVESALKAFVHALGKLDDGPEEYIIIGPWQGGPDWLEPYIGNNQRIIRGPQPPLHALRNILGPLSPVAQRLRNFFRQSLGIENNKTWPEVPVSDGFYENLGCDVIHFPFQHFTVCALPTIYNPHDLQHMHYPQFFLPTAIAWRETIYQAGCHFAKTVVAASQCVKQDLMNYYRVNPNKIQVIYWATPTKIYTEPSTTMLARVKDKYQLHLPFVFYPAITWKHKNHMRLLEALARLRDQDGLIVHLICTGSRYHGHWPQIKELLHTLHLESQIKFLGKVPSEDLRSLYRMSQFVIVPTLFEAASGPIFEAWQEGVSVACSTIPPLQEQVGDAAVLFDPFSVEDIAHAVRQMATNGSLRDEMAIKGKRRLKDFSWERTAKAYRAVYRQAAHQALTDEDRWLLCEWAKDPKAVQRGDS